MRTNEEYEQVKNKNYGLPGFDYRSVAITLVLNIISILTVHSTIDIVMTELSNGLLIQKIAVS